MADSIWWAAALVADAALCVALASRVRIGEPPPLEIDCSAETTQQRMRWLAAMRRRLVTERPWAEDPASMRTARQIARWRTREIEQLQRELRVCGTPMIGSELCYGFDVDGLDGTSAERALCTRRPDSHIRPM